MKIKLTGFLSLSQNPAMLVKLSGFSKEKVFLSKKTSYGVSQEVSSEAATEGAL